MWNVVNQCGSSKAPDPDEFNFRFIKKFWYLFKGEVMEVMEFFWENESISPVCNSSLIALIPRISDPISFGDYRPISLIECLYKIITKTLAERLKKVIGNLVGEVQNAFFGRAIYPRRHAN